MYEVIDGTTGEILNNNLDRAAAIMWASEYADDNGYDIIEVLEASVCPCIVVDRS